MEQFYKIIDRHPKINLQAIGLLSLLLEQEELFFNNEKSMLMYFRLNIYPELLDIIDPLVDEEVLVRTHEKTKTVIQVKGFPNKLVFDNKLFKSTLDEKINSYLLIHPRQIGEKLMEMFQHCREQEYVNDKKIDNYTVEKFFDAFKSIDNRLMYHLYSEFKKVTRTKTIGFKYLLAIWNGVQTKYGTKIKKVQRRKTSHENSFAISVVTGHAIKTNNIKYQLLIKNNDFNKLKEYYKTGYELLEDKSQAYKGYNWL